MDNVWSKLEKNAYANPEPWPSRPRKPVLDPNGSPAAIREYADKLEAYESYLKDYRVKYKLYLERNAELETEFRQDLEQLHGMVGHPKADLLYGKSWGMGHSAGLHEVACVYANLVDLVL